MSRIWEFVNSMSRDSKQKIEISRRSFMTVGMALLLLWNGYTTLKVPELIRNIQEIPSIIQLQRSNQDEIKKILEILARNHIVDNQYQKPITFQSYE